MRWKDLKPDQRMLQALDVAGPRPIDTAVQDTKKNWSSGFADACAKMLAAELRSRKQFAKLMVFPEPDGTAEPVTRTKGGKTKKVDVAITSVGTGLLLSLSLKGGNFLDPGGSGFGKNLTGRLYELENETKTLHEYHPHAILVSVYFFPLGATEDMKKRSTFAKIVGMLRSRSGRDDPLQVSQFAKLDWSAVALYVPEDRQDGVQAGVCRYFDVFSDPPKLGKPRVETTLSLREFGDKLVRLHKGEGELDIDYVDPEPN